MAESQPPQGPLCRRAVAGDAAQIAEIIAELIEEPQPVAFDRALSAAEVQDAWLGDDDGAAVFVIEEAGRLLAFAVVEPIEGAPEDCSLGAWVREAERRKGYATALAEEALAFTRERGYRAIRARLPEDNEPALSYLSSIGALVPLTNPGAHFVLPAEE
ncbi:MAG: GNAT family N-acetyltransferase [Chloroflexi bacterium]|nr:GNAT family N-acetyltransferase [Chloroflexota bacterium]